MVAGSGRRKDYSFFNVTDIGKNVKRHSVTPPFWPFSTSTFVLFPETDCAAVYCSGSTSVLLNRLQYQVDTVSISPCDSRGRFFVDPLCGECATFLCHKGF